jgi:hypothetical protein
MTRTESAGHISAEDGWKHAWEWAGHMRQAMESACRQVGLQQIGIAQNTQYILHNGYSYKNIEHAMETVYERLILFRNNKHI